jgi:acetylglutamate kinase
LIEENSNSKPKPKPERYFLNNSQNLQFNNLVVKIGGSTLGSGDTTFHDLVALQKQGMNPVVVHGGGKLIDKWLGQLGVMPKFVDGLRVTDFATLQVVIAVLSGVVNTAIVSSINQLGGNALGISGVDSNIIVGEIDRPKLGLVAGKVVIDARMLKTLIDSGIIPVIAPIAANLNSQNKPYLNANADTVAGAVGAITGMIPESINVLSILASITTLPATKPNLGLSISPTIILLSTPEIPNALPPN